MNRSWLAFQQYLAASVAIVTLFFCLEVVDIKSPEEDLYGKVT